MAICGICDYEAWQTRTKRLVRDHNHTTGMIRGLLCDDCNQLLGIHENKHRFSLTDLNKGRQAEYRNWSGYYKAEIEAHLLKDTGVVYQVRGQRRVSRPRPVTKIQQRFQEARARTEGIKVGNAGVRPATVKPKVLAGVVCQGFEA